MSPASLISLLLWSANPVVAFVKAAIMTLVVPSRWTFSATLATQVFAYTDVVSVELTVG